jgi:hypothetical protein
MWKAGHGVMSPKSRSFLFFVRQMMAPIDEDQPEDVIQILDEE